MNPLEITVAGLPPTNAADRRGHWTYHKVAKTWQAKTIAAVLTALGRWPETPLDRAHVTIIRCSTTEPDYDGLVAAGKHLLDGLVRAGVLSDDAPKVIGKPEYRWERAPRGAGCVRIRVEAAPVVEIGPKVSAILGHYGGL